MKCNGEGVIRRIISFTFYTMHEFEWMNEWTCECLLCARVSVLLCIWLITTFKEYFNGIRQFALHPFNQYAMRITHTRLICVKQLIIFNAFSIARVCILLLPFIDFPFKSVQFDWNANHILIWARSVITGSSWSTFAQQWLKDIC